MKKSELIKIIKEEMENILAEQDMSDLDAALDGGGFNTDRPSRFGKERDIQKKLRKKNKAGTSEMDRLRALVKKRVGGARVSRVDMKGSKVTYTLANGKSGSFTMTAKEMKHVETGAKL